MISNYYKINDKLIAFDDPEEHKGYVRGKYEGYVHKLKDSRVYGRSAVEGELIINNKYFKQGWVENCCLGEEVPKEEWDKAYQISLNI